MSFNFSIFVSQPPDAFGMADGYVDLAEPPEVGEQIDVLSGRMLPSEMAGFNGRLTVQNVIDVAAIGPLLALEDVVLVGQADAVRLRDFLEDEANLFVTDWQRDLGFRPRSELVSLIPERKLDTERAKAIVDLGYPAIATLLPELFEWLGDINWPVAQVFAPFLASIGAPLRPHIKGILETSDEVLKYNILQYVVAESPALQDSLEGDLTRIAKDPRPGEKKEECDLVAQEILDRRAATLSTQ